ncbi:hypothetical protein BCR42DRAFT_416971, partial [Absidia repens]
MFGYDSSRSFCSLLLPREPSIRLMVYFLYLLRVFYLLFFRSSFIFTTFLFILFLLLSPFFLNCCNECILGCHRYSSHSSLVTVFSQTVVMMLL